MKKPVELCLKQEKNVNRTDNALSYSYLLKNMVDFLVGLGKGFENLTPVQGNVLDFWDIYLPLLQKQNKAGDEL